MTDVPETRYAKAPDGSHIAYQVVGNGPFDVIYVPGWFSHVEMWWESPQTAEFLRRLASFSRLILFDKRGTGLSDPVPVAMLPSLEEWMEDVRTVMDVVGSERAALIGASDGGPMAMLFAATYPARTSALVLSNSFARIARADDYPWGTPRRFQESVVQQVEDHWGEGLFFGAFNPETGTDDDARMQYARWERNTASPGVATAIWRMIFEIDVRAILPVIQTPTLVVHRVGNRVVLVEHGRYLAEHIPGAKYIETPGEGHFMFGSADPVVDETEAFLTGTRQGPAPDRVLTTVLFTDIVESTEHAAVYGDRRWHQLLDRHDSVLERQLARFNGQKVRVTGDGLLATFDGPGRAIYCATSMRDAVRALGIEIRVGLHTGEVELRGGDPGGLAVHIGQRVCSAASAGEVLVSRTVVDLVAGSGIAFEDRGEHELKGVPGTWRLHAVKS